MKRILISSLAALSLLTLSCQREEMGRVKPGEDEKEKKMIHVTFGASFDSPTDENGTKVTIDSAFIKWSEGDTIKVGGGEAPNKKFTLIAGAGSNSAKFEGDVTESDTYVAHYPFELGGLSSYNAGTLMCVTAVPSVQAIPAEKTVDPSAVIMFAATADTSNLPFQNAVSYLKVTPNVNCDKIVFRDTCGTAAPFAGGSVLSVAISKDAFTVTTLQRSGTTSDSLVATGNFTAGSTYYLAVAPGKHQKGLKLDFLSSTGDTLARSSKSDSCYFEAGKVYNCGGGKEILYTDLSKGGDSTANCYLVSQAGLYKFKATKGNESTVISDIASVSVLWESYSNNTAISAGDIIDNSPMIKNGYICFSTNTTFKEGNALIAAKNSDGDILWSWHIWCSDRPEEQVYNSNAGTVMDRNLGALTADKTGLYQTFGLYYQWGRKDPFTGAGSHNKYGEGAKAKSTSYPTIVARSAAIGSGSNALEYSIKNPTHFINSGSSTDWYSTSVPDRDRWTVLSKKKSLYDPCPAGWRIMDADSTLETIWGTDHYTSHTCDWSGTSATENFGADFGSGHSSSLSTASSVWYHAAGRITVSSGALYFPDLSYSGASILLWIATANWDQSAKMQPQVLEISGKSFDLDNYTYPDNAIPVRCMKDTYKE